MQPYQERLLIEFVELYDKRTKLAQFIEKTINDQLTPTLRCPLGLLQAQCAVMDAYLCVLKERVRCEHLQTELEGYMYKFLKSEGGSEDGTIRKTEDQNI